MDESISSNPDMAYDLRQRYAKIVGDHIEDVATHRKNRDYPEYFRALEDLHTISKHKFKNQTKKIKVVKIKDGKRQKPETQEITYDSLREKAIEVSNDYSHCWLGGGSDETEISEIEKALRAMEEWLYFKMSEGNMFGSKRDREGLT